MQTNKRSSDDSIIKKWRKIYESLNEQIDNLSFFQKS